MPTPTLVTNISSYTEVDGSGWITLTNQRATMENMGRNADSYAYFDGGANWVNALDFKVIARMETTTGTAPANAITVCGFTVSTIDDFTAWKSSDVALSMLRSLTTSELRLYRGFAVASDSFTISAGTTYYLTLVRTAASDSISCLVYSDAARTTLLDTLTVSGYGTGTRYRYHYATTSQNNGTAGTEFDGYWDYAEDFGTLYPLAVAGAISPAGALVKRVARALAGAISPAGALVAARLLIFLSDLQFEGDLIIFKLKAYLLRVRRAITFLRGETYDDTD